MLQAIGRCNDVLFVSNYLMCQEYIIHLHCNCVSALYNVYILIYIYIYNIIYIYLIYIHFIYSVFVFMCTFVLLYFRDVYVTFDVDV